MTGSAWQAKLPFAPRALTPACWSKALSRHLGRRVEVVFNRARATPVQVRWQGILRVEVKLHEMFRDAPDDVVEALAAWMRSGRRARKRAALLDRWLAHRLEKLPPKAPRRVRLHTRGHCHDLAEIADALLQQEFAGDFGGELPRPRITWGRRARSPNRHSIQLGSFDPETRVVRVHPVLDREDVPRWYVRYILFHELLHAALPSTAEGRRRVHHPPEFRRRERRYPDYPRAVRWEASNLRRLMRLARRGPRP